VQRVLSKETWLTKQQISPPWPLHADTPTIVSFYSYKGGVGRSTLVAIVASLLARAGDRVIVIDLDLEAPGQQTLFAVEPERGVIDYAIEHVALGSAGLQSLLIDVATQVEGATGTVHLVPAGSLGWSYVEKLARLDFAAHTSEAGDSPVHEALTSLLKRLKAQNTPDWILLDARTGIHDLGGLAMHAFAHVDVLVGRDGRQAQEGLKLCLEALARRRRPEDIRPLIVHALAPAPLDDAQVSIPVQEAFRSKVYDVFRNTVYSSLDDSELPALEDTGAVHRPFPVPLDPTLGRLETLTSFKEHTGRPYYERIVERLRELAEPEEPEEPDGLAAPEEGAS
jgi:MinD-like ATPase involved in chromosome partitioning or flagellar assembly